MSAFLGTIGEFNCAEESFELYLSRMDAFYLANDIEDAKKVPVFLSVVGKYTFKLLTDLLSPETPGKATYKKITDTLKAHFEPQINIIYERFKFYKRDQNASETNTKYIAELKVLASKCKFGVNLNDHLRDRFVAGLSDESTQKVLLAMKNLATETAFAREAASKDSSDMHKIQSVSSNDTHSIYAKPQNLSNYQHKPYYQDSYQLRQHFEPRARGNTLQYGSQNSRKGNSLPSTPCSGCGAQHWHKSCPYLHKKCSVCNRIGHNSKICFFNKENNKFTNFFEKSEIEKIAPQMMVTDNSSNVPSASDANHSNVATEYVEINYTDTQNPINMNL